MLVLYISRSVLLTPIITHVFVVLEKSLCCDDTSNITYVCQPQYDRHVHFNWHSFVRPNFTKQLSLLHYLMTNATEFWLWNGRYTRQFVRSWVRKWAQTSRFKNRGSFVFSCYCNGQNKSDILSFPLKESVTRATRPRNEAKWVSLHNFGDIFMRILHVKASISTFSRNLASDWCTFYLWRLPAGDISARLM